MTFAAATYTPVRNGSTPLLVPLLPPPIPHPSPLPPTRSPPLPLMTDDDFVWQKGIHKTMRFSSNIGAAGVEAVFVPSWVALAKAAPAQLCRGC